MRTVSRAVAIAASSSSSRGPADGQSERCTEAPPPSSPSQISSATNGVNGASSWETVSRHSRSVANAAASPAQKRRRLRRTYQLERSSTKAWIARPANVAS